MLDSSTKKFGGGGVTKQAKNNITGSKKAGTTQSKFPFIFKKIKLKNKRCCKFSMG